ncbi:MAG: hypothetical protein UY02_C0019G0010, partial [Candidatus Giovannonibacteria bacterium GW2011_GWB1_47_6b]
WRVPAESKIKGVKLWIVGQHIPRKIASYTDGEVIVDNLKESDEESIRRAYFNASVFVESRSYRGIKDSWGRKSLASL